MNTPNNTCWAQTGEEWCPKKQKPNSAYCEQHQWLDPGPIAPCPKCQHTMTDVGEVDVCDNESCGWNREHVIT